MKTFIKYISLLLVSGLILPFYTVGRYSKQATLTTHLKQPNSDKLQSKETPYPQYFTLQQIIEFAIPTLKK